MPGKISYNALKMQGPTSDMEGTLWKWTNYFSGIYVLFSDNFISLCYTGSWRLFYNCLLEGFLFRQGRYTKNVKA